MESVKKYFSDLGAAPFFSIAEALLVFVVGYVLVKLLCRLLSRIFKKKSDLDPSFQHFLIILVRIIGYAIITLICADLLSIPTTSLITLLGTFGLALSLSLQDIIANVASGIFIMTSKPFFTDDWIEASGHDGTVKKIGLVHTTLITAGNQTVSIPNGKLSTDTIVNYSRAKTRRLDLTLPVPYECSLRDARRIIEDTVRADARVLRDPAPLVRVWELSASSVDIKVRVWTACSDYWELRSALLEGLKCALDDGNMSVPYNHLTLTLNKGDKH